MKKSIKFHLKLILRKVKLLKLLLLPCDSRLGFIAKSFVSIATTWNSELVPVQTYMSMFDILRQRKFQGSFLELGGGFSTVIALNIFDSNKVFYTSVDVNPGKYIEIFNSKRDAVSFLNNINHIDLITVSLEDVYFGIEMLRINLKSFDKEDLLVTMRKYVHENQLACMLCDLIHDKSDGLKRYFESHQNFIDDLIFYKMVENESDTFVKSMHSQVYDAIFFDCGEISSMGEWAKLYDKIPKGGYALFHDIFHPKSIKNFLICVYLDLSPDWEILYSDKVSSQGGLVAVRV
jgi:hypothetical protein